MALKLLIFSASWCQPCKQLKPIIEELAREYSLSYEEIDVDWEKGAIAARYGVMSVPCVVFLQNGGSVVDMVHGVKPKSFFRSIIERLQSAQASG